MDDYNFSIENDTLVRNEISRTEAQDVFTVKKVPVITKEAFIQLNKMWGKEEEKDDGK